MSTPNSYPTSVETRQSGGNNTADAVPSDDRNTAGNKLARSFWLSYSLMASGVAGAIAIGLILWGDRTNEINLIWAGSILFAVVVIVWLVLVGILTLWVFLDLIRTISGLVKGNQFLDQVRIGKPPVEQHDTGDQQGDDDR